MVKIFEYVDFGDDFRNTSILVKILKIWIVDKIFEKSPFWSKFSKIRDFGQNFLKILIELKIFEISRFWPKFRKKAILVKIFENLNFGEDFRKISNLIKFSENRDFDSEI